MMKIFGYEIKKQDAVKTKSYSKSLSSLLNNGFVINQNTYYYLYGANPDIRQAIRKIAGSVARNGLYFVDNQKQVVDNEKLNAELNDFFSLPTFAKFKIELFKNYLLSGELYIMPIKNLKGETAGFTIIDSRAVNKQLDGKGNIIAFHINQRNGTQLVLKPEDISFFKLEDDINDTTNGMGLMTGIVYDALCDLEASKTNYSLYQNSSIPNAMVLLDGDLTENEQQIARDMFEAQFRGSENSHKLLVGGGIKDIKTLSITPRDMEFINQRHLTTEKISAVYGVPKSILGYIDNVNYSNAGELRKEFIEGTIRPYEKDLEHILNSLFAKYMPKVREQYYIACDGEQLEEKQERFEGQRKDIASGILTINEVRADRGLEKINEENCDKLLISNSMGLLEDITLSDVLNGVNEE